MAIKETEEAMLRIDKYLADMGYGTRTQIKKLVGAKQVSVNDSLVLNASLKVDENKDEVKVENRIVSYSRYEYYMLHKPAGYVSATTDKKDKTVMELLPEMQRKDLFPVGRLDKDTEGLLLITNDGKLSHQLLSPKKHIDKVYFAKINTSMSEAEACQLEAGVDIGDDTNTLPAKVELLQEEAPAQIKITIQEGRYHQVKRMFEAIDKEVIYLKRLSMGSLFLDESLALGRARALTKEELERLQTNDRG